MAGLFGISRKMRDTYAGMGAGMGRAAASGQALKMQDLREANEAAKQRQMGIDDVNMRYKEAQIAQVNRVDPVETFSNAINPATGLPSQLSSKDNKYNDYATSKEPPRKMFKGADGYNYWGDTLTRVLKKVEKAPDFKPMQPIKMTKEDGSTQQMVQNQKTGEYEPYGAPAQSPTWYNEKRKGTLMFHKVEDSIGRYRALLKSYGPTILPNEAKVKLSSSYSDLLLELKELAELGVLAGPDMDIMEAVSANPTTLKGQLLGDDILKQLDEVLIPKVTANKSFFDDMYATPGTGSSSGIVRVNNPEEYNALPSGTLFEAPDGSTRTKP